MRIGEEQEGREKKKGKREGRKRRKRGKESMIIARKRERKKQYNRSTYVRTFQKH